QGAGHVLPARIGGREGTRGCDHAQGNQQGNLRRMSLWNAVARAGGARLQGLFRVDYPPLAVDIDNDRVSGVLLERGRPGLKLAPRASKSLPPGLIEVGMVRANVQDARLLGALVADLVAGLDRGAKRASLVVSDKVAKVSLVTLESTPRSLDET